MGADHDYMGFLAHCGLEASGPGLEIPLDGGQAWDVSTPVGECRLYRLAEATEVSPTNLSQAADLGLATSLRDESIVSVLHVRTHGQSVWALAERPRGLSLETWLSREPMLPFLEAYLVLRAMARALRLAHAASIPHGQLDAERVWWDAPRARVEGFGIFPPGESATDEDCRAFGALAHRILTGEFPDLEHRESVARTRRGVPPGLARLIWRCLSDDPQSRPDAEELARFFDHLSVPAPSARTRHAGPMAEFELRRTSRLM